MTRGTIGLFAGLVMLLGSNASDAQTAPAIVSVAFGTLRHIANDGQTNVVTITNSGSRLLVRDLAGLAAGEGCTQVNATTASCEATPTFVLDLKDGNDTVTNNANQTIFAYAGPGNDILTGGPLTDGLYGDDGSDVINGNGSLDSLNGGSGNDVINGGAGDDLISDYEGNDVVNGGAGNDQITDYGGVDSIKGEGGDDTIYSFDGNTDVIDCGTGTDSYGLEDSDVRKSCETSLL